MTILTLLTASLLCAPAGAQVRVEPVSAMRLVVAAPGAQAPLPPSPPALTAPASAPSLLLAAPGVVAAAPSAAAAPQAAAARVSAMQSGVAQVLAGLTKEQPRDGAAASSAGRALEDILTGARSAAADSDLPAPSAPSASMAQTPVATPAELEHAAQAAARLASLADDMGDERGQKAGRMTGSEFIALLEAARQRSDSQDSDAPSPAAARAARVVRAQIVRVVRALTDPHLPLSDGIRRTLSVWQVFDSEMAEAARKGNLEAVEAEARLFASQVEASVPPARPRPEDPNDYAAVNVPGSVFGWKPIEDSPSHGLPPLDALIRFVLREDSKHRDPTGFVLPGAARREEAAVHFYGERHTDGGLIEENMRRLAADMRPGRPAIVLVEGYTGPDLRAYAAASYLRDRGLDIDSLPEGSPIELRGWDTIDGYDASKHPLLQHHMDLLELNRLAHSEQRGLGYYARFARAAWTAVRGWKELWAAAITARNADLDRAVARAAADADRMGGTLHVIAGSDHLLENPRLSRLPLVGRPRFRSSLRAALGGRTYWASKPPDSPR